mgnify:CR=1 FL=1
MNMKWKNNFYFFSGGRWRVKALPRPGTLSRVMCPPWSWAIFCTMDRPSPAPGPPAQLHPHMALRPAVLEAVVDQVLEQAGEQGSVPLDEYAGLRLCQQPLPGAGLLGAYLLHQL